MVHHWIITQPHLHLAYLEIMKGAGLLPVSELRTYDGTSRWAEMNYAMSGCFRVLTGVKAGRR